MSGSCPKFRRSQRHWALAKTQVFGWAAAPSEDLSLRPASGGSTDSRPHGHLRDFTAIQRRQTCLWPICGYGHQSGSRSSFASGRSLAVSRVRLPQAIARVVDVNSDWPSPLTCVNPPRAGRSRGIAQGMSKSPLVWRTNRSVIRAMYRARSSSLGAFLAGSRLIGHVA